MDAAFARVGNPGRGFSFAGSPFGRDRFDLHHRAEKGRRYQDVFTGFVFYRPLEAHRLALGVPGLVDPEFLEEVKRRLSVVDPAISTRRLRAKTDEIARLNEVRRDPYDRIDGLRAEIARFR